jgi:hypothetical protein
MSWSEYTHFVFGKQNLFLSCLDGSEFVTYSSNIEIIFRELSLVQLCGMIQEKEEEVI